MADDQQPEGSRRFNQVCVTTTTDGEIAIGLRNKESPDDQEWIILDCDGALNTAIELFSVALALEVVDHECSIHGKSAAKGPVH